MSKNNPLECKLCKVIFKSKSRMMKHLISKKHLENLINITIEPFEILDNDTHNSNEVDPFLNKNDINKLKNMDIGDGFDIAYKNNDVVKCEYVFEEKQYHVKQWYCLMIKSVMEQLQISVISIRCFSRPLMRIISQG